MEFYISRSELSTSKKSDYCKYHLPSASFIIASDIADITNIAATIISIKIEFFYEITNKI